MAMKLGRIICVQASLPTEVEEEILVRLPVKDLLRSRAVCKPWKTLIDSISFKKKHLLFAKKFLSTLLLCRNLIIPRARHHILDDDSKLSLHIIFPNAHEVSPSLDYDYIVDPTFIDKKTSVNFPPDDLPRYKKFGVANGLVLLCWNKFPVVWNPLSNHFKKIDPPPRFKAPDAYKWLNADIYTFGFDPETQDYKILFAFFHGDTQRTDMKCKVTFQLYSLMTDSWKTVSVNFPHFEFLVRGDGFMDSKFYWLAKGYRKEDGSRGTGIISFDFTNETFEATPLPESLVDKDWWHRKETVVVVTTRGCLELIKSFEEGEKGLRCEIWGMGEDGLWSRKVEVSLPPGVGIPRGVTKDGQLVCPCPSPDLVTNVTEILLFNPNTGAYKNLGHGSSGFEVFTYVESLFSINK